VVEEHNAVLQYRVQELRKVEQEGTSAFFVLFRVRTIHINYSHYAEKLRLVICSP
jgi:hypothetical protein